MTHAIILAGGKGKRLNTSPENPKVLLPVRGVPIILRVLHAIRPICDTPTIVVGFGADQVIAATGNRYHYVYQEKQLGTGHAVQCAASELSLRRDIQNIIVLYGDHPFINGETFQRLVAIREKSGAEMAMATVTVPNFDGDYRSLYSFGRILRDENGRFRRIVELKDADEDTRRIQEVNPGYYCFAPEWLWNNIGKLSNENAAHEFYLTDLIGIAIAEGKRVETLSIADPHEAMGVNTAEELAIAERFAAENEGNTAQT